MELHLFVNWEREKIFLARQRGHGFHTPTSTQYREITTANWG